ncbi:MAG: peptide-methionine (S)-S-oxide reductase MsrA [Boseongicola sp. SB0664_bin_43]|uniref:Peptide methionine sulfoxide reductase MsrA n=1 Tax=Boseongicola sp. SB0664_bin_43 TaxID=2604844 RepID=A0A6B0Y196_9RHOB|nr:peptide-methionine (S)-S-oxide reductase MsrA [Boseongicola sp. SB0664_bin_43]MYK30506.1 peptide-methionine (S)-S-oxide reductase MsrA [Boseongicola sp. SB0670_bin_30]
MFQMFRNNRSMVSAVEALPGRDMPVPTAERHFVTDRPVSLDLPDGHEAAMFGMGCFWGVERKFWSLEGVWVTMVGYAAGHTPNPTYEEVCSGRTGHNEVVRVIHDPASVSFDDLLRVFWEGHDPTQGMRQGNDVGTQYRSGIYWTTDAQRAAAESSKEIYAQRLAAAGYGDVTTEILPDPPFYFAEDYHQQYLAKNPHGYCGVGGTGVTCPVGTGVAA